MAASVLGKRTRSTFDLEETSPPLQSRKRRTRNAIPQIHTDDAEPSQSRTPQDAAKSIDLDGPKPNTPSTRPTPARNNARKQDVCIPFPTNKSFLKSNVVEIAADENAHPQFETPTAVRFRDAIPAKIPITLRHRVRPAGVRPATPSTGASPTSRSQTVYSIARQLFTQSSTPGKLIGRDLERKQIKTFVLEAVKSKTGGCTYISGPPGTGKSALVQELLSEFQATQSLRCAYINCVSIQSSRDVHTRLVEAFNPDAKAGKKSQQDILANIFTAEKVSTTESYLVVLDEMDSLLDADCSVLYSLFDWALHKSSRLILIGIANALDLTDRFLPRLKARNLKPHLLPFMPYAAKDIAEIITERLRSTLPMEPSGPKDFIPFLHPAAVQLCSKKVAAQTGDLRKAFNLVRRVIDQVEQETLLRTAPLGLSTPTKQPLSELSNLETRLPPTPPKSSPLRPETGERTGPTQGPEYTPETAPRASIAHVARLSSSLFNNGTSSRLAGLNLQQKAVLCSLVASEKRRMTRDPYTTPSKSASRIPTLKDLFAKYAQLCQRDDGLLHALKVTEFRDVVASLETLGLVHESAGRASSLSTPTQTPSRAGRNPDDKQIVSGVSEKEMINSLKGPGADLLLRLFEE